MSVRREQLALEGLPDRQLSIAYPHRDLAERALGVWRSRGIVAEVEAVRDQGGRRGYAVLEAAS